MHHVVNIHRQYDKAFTYHKYQTVDKEGGKHRNFFEEYDDFPMIYIPEANRLDFDENGNLSTSVSFGVIDANFFSTNKISPSTSDKIEDAAGLVYRIVVIEDYTRLPHSNIYYVHLRRDELSAARI